MVETVFIANFLGQTESNYRKANISNSESLTIQLGAVKLDQKHSKDTTRMDPLDPLVTRQERNLLFFKVTGQSYLHL